MTLRNLLIFVNGGLLLALLSQLVVPYTNPPRTAFADWVDSPKTLEETSQLASQVVHAKVVRLRKAKPIIVKIEGEPGGVDRIPVEIVTLELVDEAAKGNGRRGAQIDVFRTGHSDADRPSKRRPPPMSQAPPKPADGIDKADAPEGSEFGHSESELVGLVGDPPYEVGDEYVLFLSEGPEVEEERGRKVKPMRIVSPEGRYKVTREGLVPMSEREFAQAQKGKPAEDLTARVKRGRN